MGEVVLRWIGAAAPLIALFAPAAAGAATITVNDTRTAVSITGTILPGDEEKFQDSVVDLPERAAIVILDSPGGIIDPALEIGQAIRLKRFSTLVRNGGECASACALVWLAGRTRFMAPEAEIGFHAAYELREDGPHERGEPNALIGAYLNRLGFSGPAIRCVTMMPPDEMVWLTFEIADLCRIEVTRWDGEPVGEQPAPKSSRGAPGPALPEPKPISPFDPPLFAPLPATEPSAPPPSPATPGCSGCVARNLFHQCPGRDTE